MEHPGEPPHLRSLHLPGLPVPVVHDPALPLAVRSVRRRQRHVERPPRLLPPPQRVRHLGHRIGAPGARQLLPRRARVAAAAAAALAVEHQRDQVVGRQEEAQGEEDQEERGSLPHGLPTDHPFLNQSRELLVVASKEWEGSGGKKWDGLFYGGIQGVG